jgi:hypothetical protein
MPMAKSIKAAVGLTGVLCLAVVTAEAGEKMERPVKVTRHISTAEASGSIGSARASANAVEGIGCAISAGETAMELVCFARSAAGVDLLCSSTAPSLIQAAAHIGDASFIEIRSENSKYAGRLDKCTGLRVENHSRNAPMVR